MAYSPDLRERVLAGYDEGLPTRQIALNLRVSKAWCKRVRQFRNQPPGKHSGRKPKLDAEGCSQLQRFVAEKPDATLNELQSRIASELKIEISTGALWNTLKRLKLTLKKSR